MVWCRGRFKVVLVNGSEVEVHGMISLPFADNANGRDRNLRRTLVHMPSGRIIATLRTARQCKKLAAELAPVLIREDRELATGVAERHRREAM